MDIDGLVTRLEVGQYSLRAASRDYDAETCALAATELTRLRSEVEALRAENVELIGLPQGFKRLADLPVDFKEIAEDGERIREAAKALVDALDACKSDIDGAFQMAWAHGCRYEGRPTYGKELVALRSALTGAG